MRAMLGIYNGSQLDVIDDLVDALRLDPVMGTSIGILSARRILSPDNTTRR